jgi:hypothetical protein
MNDAEIEQAMKQMDEGFGAKLLQQGQDKNPPRFRGGRNHNYENQLDGAHLTQVGQWYKSPTFCWSNYRSDV